LSRAGRGRAWKGRSLGNTYHNRWMRLPKRPCHDSPGRKNLRKTGEGEKLTWTATRNPLVQGTKNKNRDINKFTLGEGGPSGGERTGADQTTLEKQGGKIE